MEEIPMYIYDFVTLEQHTPFSYSNFALVSSIY
jgi:hypothetical protein